MNLNSATLMYSAVSLNEKQASSREKASRRRSKRDKYLSGDIDDDEFDDLQSQYDKMAKMNPEKAMWKAGSVLGAAGTIVTNAIAIAVETLAVNFVAGSVAVVTSTTVAYREIFDLEDIQTVKGGVNLLRRQFAKVQQENHRKTRMVEDLTTKAIGGEAVKNKLRKVSQDQDVDIHKLLSVISEYRRVFQAKRELLRRDVEAEVVRLVMKADSDHSGQFSESERRRLITSLKALPSVKVNEERLTQIIKDKNSVWALLGVIRNLKRCDTEAHFDQPIVIDLDSEELGNAIAHKAKLRASARNLGRRVSSITSFETVVKMKMMAHRMKETGQRARSASPVSRQGNKSSSPSKAKKKSKHSSKHHHHHHSSSSKPRRCRSLERRKEPEELEEEEEEEDKPTESQARFPRVAAFTHNVGEKNRQILENTGDRLRQSRDNVEDRWKRFAASVGPNRPASSADNDNANQERTSLFRRPLVTASAPTTTTAAGRQRRPVGGRGGTRSISPAPTTRKSYDYTGTRPKSPTSPKRQVRQSVGVSPSVDSGSSASGSHKSDGGAKKKKKKKKSSSDAATGGGGPGKRRGSM